jgi:hypothetical protein
MIVQGKMSVLSGGPVDRPAAALGRPGDHEARPRRVDRRAEEDRARRHLSSMYNHCASEHNY